MMITIADALRHDCCRHYAAAAFAISPFLIRHGFFHYATMLCCHCLLFFAFRYYATRLRSRAKQVTAYAMLPLFTISPRL